MSELNPKFIELIKNFEAAQFSPTAYYDPIGKKWTIGYGTTVYANGTPVKKGDKITEEEATAAIPTYLNSRMKTIKSHFPKWDLFPELTQYALMNLAYRGGENNFVTSSPKFTAAVNKALEDGFITTDEYKAIAKEMEFSTDNGTNNLIDRKQRNLALIGGMYDWEDNKSINTLGGKKNNIKRTPYTNFHNNIFYNGNHWNLKWELFLNSNNSNANFVLRLLDPNRDVLKQDDGTVATHKMAYSTTPEYDIVFPTIQEKKVYPWYNFLHIGSPSKTQLVDKSENSQKALLDAINTNDTIHVPTGMGEYYTTHYKEHYPFGLYKTGGTLNYLNYIR